MYAQQEKPTVLSILHTSTLFNAMTPGELETLSASAKLCKAERGEIIWLSGQAVDFFCMVGSGFIKMVRTSHTGTDVTLELMGPGQLFGLLGTIDGIGCPLTAIAVTESWYVKIQKSAFLPIYESNSVLKDRLIRRTSLRFHGALDLMGRMTSGRVEQRIAAIVLLLAESYGEQVDDQLRLKVPLTRQEIGEMAGTTVESTIRVLSRWQKERILSTDKHYISILNGQALEQILRC